MNMMQFLTSTAFLAGFGAGGAVIWFFKTQIQKMVLGANALSAKLHAQANALSPQVTAVVNDIKKV
jgi:hypothetical protein